MVLPAVLAARVGQEDLAEGLLVAMGDPQEGDLDLLAAREGLPVAGRAVSAVRAVCYACCRL